MRKGLNATSGIAELYDYKDTITVGSISDWIGRKVGQAAALVAFISRNYVESKYSREEWALALDLHAQRGLIIVPVIMDDHAISWWKNCKREFGERFTLAVGDAFAYANFSSLTGGRPEDIVTRDGTIDAVTRKIAEVAR